MRTTSLAYLLPVAAVALAGPTSGQNPLPAGAGKQVIEDVCVACHELGRITNAGHTHDEWDMIVHEMIMMGAALRPAQVLVVTDYLASNFPAFRTIPTRPRTARFGTRDSWAMSWAASIPRPDRSRTTR